MHEAVLENGFADHAGALGDRVERGELGLHVGGKTGVRRRDQVDCLRSPAAHVQLDAVAFQGDACTGFFKLIQNRIHGAGPRVDGTHSAAGHGGGNEKSAGFNPIGQDLVFVTLQPIPADHGNGIGAVAADFGAHADQALGQINHLRLLGGVFDQGGAFGQGRRHQDVFRTRHGDRIEHHPGAAQSLGAGVDIATLHADLRTHGGQPLEMKIDRARADGTAPGQRHPRRAVSGQQGPQHQNRGAHGLDQIVGGQIRAQAGRIQTDPRTIADRDINAHLAQQLHGRGHVTQMRHTAETTGLVGQQSRHQDRQHGVLGAGNLDCAG